MLRRSINIHAGLSDQASLPANATTITMRLAGWMKDGGRQWEEVWESFRINWEWSVFVWIPLDLLLLAFLFCLILYFPLTLAPFPLSVPVSLSLLVFCSFSRSLAPSAPRPLLSLFFFCTLLSWSSFHARSLLNRLDQTQSFILPLLHCQDFLFIFKS